ncbi:MAG: hypothetical protein WA912_06865 [Ornithinimicrobium sp.]
MELSPGESTGEVGSSFTWTATVTSGGESVPGAEVTFLGQLDGKDDESASGTTDAAGQVSHTHTRSTSGVEDLTVVATDGEREVSDNGQREWTQVPDPGGSVTPERPDPPDPETPPEQEDDPQIPELEEELTPVPPTKELGPDTPTGPLDGLKTVETELASVAPGGDLAVSGTGCEPGATVEVALAGVLLGTATADEEGTFAGRFAVPDVPLGQYVVTATCGDLVGETFVDVVVSASAAIGGAQTVTVALVLVFFVLLGSSLVRGLSGHAVPPTGS